MNADLVVMNPYSSNNPFQFTGQSNGHYHTIDHHQPKYKTGVSKRNNPSKNSINTTNKRSQSKQYKQDVRISLLLYNFIKIGFRWSIVLPKV